MDERHARFGRRTGEALGAAGVQLICLVAVLLGPVDVRPRGAVDRRVGTNPREGLFDGRGVGDIELVAGQPDQLMARVLARAHDVAAEHAGGAGDEQPARAHRIEMSELSPTMKR